MVKDKYLEEFDKMVGKKRWTKGMKAYRRGRGEELSSPDLTSALKKLRENPDDSEVRAEMKGLADSFINMSRKGVAAVEIYQILEEYKPSTKKKVVDFARKYLADENKNVPNYHPESVLPQIREFLEGESNKGKGLEKKTTVVLGVLGIIASLFFLSPVITGNAIGNLNTSNSSIIGIIFFVCGLAGLFISSRHR